MAVDVRFLRARAHEPLVPVFPVPLIRRAEKCYPTRPPQSPQSRSRSTRSCPEHENNEPALGVVAELVDQRG